MKIRQLHIEDYESVYALWKSCGMELGASDSREEIARFIGRNADTSLVGETEGKIIACVLGGFDGRRGLVHHLAVDPALQGKGLGRQMLSALEDKFREMGVIKLSFWVKTNNLDVVKFYNKLGYESREDIITMSKVL